MNAGDQNLCEKWFVKQKILYRIQEYQIPKNNEKVFKIHISYTKI